LNDYFVTITEVRMTTRLVVSGGGNFFKVGGTSARHKTYGKLFYCSSNWQLWRHKYWNMTY